MAEKRRWLWQSFLVCFIFNAILAVALFWPFREGLKVVSSYLEPLLSNADLKAQLPKEVMLLITNLQDLVIMTEKYAIPAIFGAVGIVTLAMWIVIALVGAKRIEAAAKGPLTPEKPDRDREERVEEKPVKKAEKVDERRRLLPAVQFIALMQREGRFVDFLKEDISLYEDSQIGAAVRTLHDEWRKIFDEHVKVEPVYSEVEGTEVVIEKGFDPVAIRLTGRVLGDPPFKGIVKHRGWRLVRIELPQMVDPDRDDLVLAPAEVEVQQPSEGGDSA